MFPTEFLKRMLWTSPLVVFLIIGPALARQADQLPLAENGPYFVGRQTLTFVDSDRQDRTLVTEIWYPAIKPEDEDLSASIASVGLRDAEPDADHAPYPLILSSPWWSANRSTNSNLLAHLSSYGFVVASVDHDCDHEPTCLIDRPLDLLFVLDQLAGITGSNLTGVINTDQTGVMGISYGGYTALAMGGARIDPDFFLDWYANDKEGFPFLENGWGTTFDRVWDDIAAYRAQFDVLEAGELWPAMTDERIRAVLPMVPALTELFGERGLEAVTVPTLILAATDDEYVPYERDIVPLYTYLGQKELYLISFVGYSHHPEMSTRGENYYQHFSAAFFGYYLQGQQDYAAYLTSDFVANFDDLTWGLFHAE